MSKNSPINKKTSALTVNSAYSLPTTDGDADQVLITDGAGTVTWEDNAPTGIVVQEVYNSTASVITINSFIYFDDTIPQSTEGVEVITVSITPTSSSNILIIEATAYFSGATNSGNISGALFQDSTSNAIMTNGIGYTTNVIKATNSFILRRRISAGTTSATTFKLRVGRSGAGSAYINGDSVGNRRFGGNSLAQITVKEYSA